ncbi:MAG: orotidine-5'-phosphate decarboxylase [Candidatus Marinimicrobia bacterium]|nr:orotidine-5'-phosphate decarboxylase [Candidatus Neomarinimicrobiota bacterium]
MKSFTSRLKERIESSQSWLCVGLDITPEGMGQKDASFGDVKQHAKMVIDATKDLAAAYKPNLAFFERWGIAGFEWLIEVIEQIGEGPVIIGDAKRGDIGNTAKQYAKSMFDYFHFDAVTVNPYMGVDSIAPFIERAQYGAFVLARTSNKSAANYQNHEKLGNPVYISVAKDCQGLNSNDNVGLVIGATAPEELKKIRKVAPDLPLLIPGVGTQGGDLETSIKIGNYSGPAIINVSRGISFAGDHSPDAIRKAAEDYVSEMREFMNE